MFICLSSRTVFVRRSIKANDRSQPIYALVQVMNTSCAAAFMLKPQKRNTKRCAIWCENTIQGLYNSKTTSRYRVIFNWHHLVQNKKSHEPINGPFRWRISGKSSSGWHFLVLVLNRVVPGKKSPSSLYFMLADQWSWLYVVVASPYWLMNFAWYA